MTEFKHLSFVVHSHLVDLLNTFIPNLVNLLGEHLAELLSLETATLSKQGRGVRQACVLRILLGSVDPSSGALRGVFVVVEVVLVVLSLLFMLMIILMINSVVHS